MRTRLILIAQTREKCLMYDTNEDLGFISEHSTHTLIMCHHQFGDKIAVLSQEIGLLLVSAQKGRFEN